VVGVPSRDSRVYDKGCTEPPTHSLLCVFVGGFGILFAFICVRKCVFVYLVFVCVCLSLLVFVTFLVSVSVCLCLLVFVCYLNDSKIM
jgi:hypothetical protein